MDPSEVQKRTVCSIQLIGVIMFKDKNYKNIRQMTLRITHINTLQHYSNY